MIFVAFIGGLAAAKKWGPAHGIITAYLLYMAYGLWPLINIAATAALLIYARGLAGDRLTVYAFTTAYAKFLLLPYAISRPIPYYEALWYAAEASPLWRTYAPLTYLPEAPPLQLALEGTLFAAGATALAARALADVVGRQAVFWPLLAPEPLWFGHMALSIPLAWTAAYYATNRRHLFTAFAVLLAAGFHVHGGLLAVFFSALYGAAWTFLLAGIALVTPQSWVLTSLIWRIPGVDPVQIFTIALSKTPLWQIKTIFEAALLSAIALTTGRAQLVAWLGVLGALLTARVPAELAGFVYCHFLAVLPFARLDGRLYAVLATLSLPPFLLQVTYFGLDWEWALKYAEALARGEPAEGPVAEAYREIYGEQAYREIRG